MQGRQKLSEMKENMKLKNIKGIALIMTAMLLLGGCGRKNTETGESLPDRETRTGTEDGSQTGTLPGDTLPEETGEDNGRTEEAVLPLHLIKGELSDSYYKDDDYSNKLVEMKYGVIALTGEDEEKYPKLAQVLKKLSEENKNTILNEYENLKTQAEDDLKGAEEGGYQIYTPYSAESTYYVSRADDRVLSFEENGYTYLGGAHGTGYSFGCNYDTRTGEELQIQDVVTDMDTFAGLAEAAVYEESGLTMDDLFLEEGESLKDYIAKAAAEHTLNWKITNDGVSVWFNPYEISYYAAGMPSGSVKFAEQTDIFSDYYAEAPRTYVYAANNLGTSGMDFNGDGRTDELRVWASMDEYGTYEALKVSMNGVETGKDIWAYSYDPYILHTADGKNYLYVICGSDNDYRMLEVFDLNGSSAVYVGEVNNCGLRAQLLDASSYLYGEELLTDPENFYLESRMEVLSTYSASRRYHVGADGMPVADEDFYQVDTSTYEWREALTAKKDVPCVQVAEDGSVTADNAVIPAGTKLTLYRTDGSSLVDLKAGDTLYRIEVDHSEWPYTINGVEEEEYFDGIMYAG